MNPIIIEENLENKSKSQVLEILKYIYKVNNNINNESINNNSIIIEKENQLPQLILNYYDNPKILETDKNFLILYIKEIIEYLKNNNNFLIPFLVPTNDLIQAYINSDLDEDIQENDNKEKNLLNYNRIFYLLKKNSFISKEIIMSIYSYFSSVYNNINNNKLTKYNFNKKKFRKMINLWKMFYTFNDNKNDYAISSFCLIGTGLLISFNKSFSLDKNYIIIKIKFYENDNDIINNNYSELFEKKIKLLNIDNVYSINYYYIKDFYDNKNVKLVLMSFKIFKKQINIIILYKLNNSKKIIKKEIIVKEKTINNISNIKLLENYIGQINIIKIKLYIKEKKEHKCYSEYLFKPLPNVNNEYLRSINENCAENNILEKENGNNIYKIKIIDKNLFKTNYINYNHNTFNIVDYFGGIIQLLPFADLIKLLYLNEQLNNNIIEKGIKELYISFINDILYGLFQSLLYSKKNTKIIKKYYLFVFSILFELCIIIFKDEDDKEIKEKVQLNINQYIVENIEKIDIEKQKLMHLYIKYANFGTIKNETLIKEIEILVKEFINDEIKKDNKFIDMISFQQLYEKLMKQLFIFNRFWSNKNAFFNKEYKDIHKIKYKQSNHYTKNYQRPIMYPILEISKYYPKFKKFNIDNLYKNKDKILEYNFDFFGENNIIIKLIDSCIKKYNQNNIEISLKCCLVKQFYHIKGNLILKQIEKNNKKKFKLIFISDNTVEGCNIPEIEKKDSEEPQLCYGSPFPSPNFAYKYKKIIKSKDIIFILKREYFHRVSAIEIFTFNNKSYLFNFYEHFNVNIENIEDNKFYESNIILSKISEYFENTICNKKEKIDLLLGYINKRYEAYIYPLLHDDHYNYYSNYDKLILINLFSNRSFNDIYQYPIFPMFYENLNLKRDMSKHIGLQTINESSIERKKNILFSYNMNIDVNNEDLTLFNIFYSNPVFLSHYLVRVFPYSLLSIEFQGDGFDTPNRLFFSIENSLHNSLIQKSDLREMIPELFYLPELYCNINELNLGKVDDSIEIDNVVINNNEYSNFDKYKYITQLKDNLENENNLNLWIDLIFGINQKEGEDKIKYYADGSIVNYENNEKYYNDSINLKCTDFGVIPFQILNSKYPNIDFSFKKNTENIKKYCIEEFEKEHLISDIGEFSFICKINFLISKEYLKFINEKEIFYHINSYDENKFFYIFKGDIVGNVFIYMKYNNLNERNNYNTLIYRPHHSKKDVIKNNTFKMQSVKKKNNNNIHEIKKICDHTKEIKYIDCNPRLNLFLSYSLDGYINIYTFPKCKLISVIKINNYIKEEEPLIKVVLISNPFPMIFCYNDTNIFVFTINGELINKKEKDKYINLYPCVDKSLGLIKDNIRIIKSITGNIINNSEIDLPFLNNNIL